MEVIKFGFGGLIRCFGGSMRLAPALGAVKCIGEIGETIFW